jgi:glycosyltransferase involved in cell wall biosynthesis
LGVADRVDLLGGVYGEQLEDLYRAATVLVLPSRIEGFGLPALEAMVRGVPVIAANRTALPEVVAKAGLLIDPDDSADLAARIVELANDPSLRARLVSAGLRRADELSWERAADSYVRLFDRVSQRA